MTLKIVRYINVIKETRYNKFFHIFVYEAHARYALYKEELKHLNFYLLIVISIIVIAIGIVRALLSINELNELVQQASEDLQTALSEMNPKFMEIFVLKQVFISQIDKLRDEFTMSSKLVDFQEFLLKRPATKDAKARLENLLKKYCVEDYEISDILESKSSKDINSDNDFYLEWCRYNDSLILEKDYRNATQQKKSFNLPKIFSISYFLVMII